MRKIYLFFLVFLIIPSPILAHPGGLDAHGCHLNHKTGEYHCHRPQGLFTTGKIRKKGEKGLNYYKDFQNGDGLRFTPKVSGSDGECSCVKKRVCIGPRGGHYCINGSGNKRYLKH